jgi:hypothetical protein
MATMQFTFFRFLFAAKVRGWAELTRWHKTGADALANKSPQVVQRKRRLKKGQKNINNIVKSPKTEQKSLFVSLSRHYCHLLCCSFSC